MNLLTGYSSSDEEPEDDQPTKLISSHENPANSVRLGNGSSSSSSLLPTVVSNPITAPVGTKKRKAIIFSTLPIEIQNALTRGSTAQDSDSDDEPAGLVQKSEWVNKSFNSGCLMSLLPAPKNSSSDLIKGASASTSRPPQPSASNVRAPLIPVSVEENEIATTNYNSDDDDSSGILPFNVDSLRGESMFSLSSANLPATIIPLQEIAVTASHSTAFVAPKRVPLHAADEATGNLGTMSNNFPDSFRGPDLTMSSSAPLSAFRSSSYEQVSQTEAAVENYGNGSIARKRRERDIEQQLISGNLEAAQSMGGGMKEMRASNDWNAHAYTTQKQNEAELHKAFFAGKGGEKAIAPVSKLQGRKHQINSLVMAAAKTELALLNAKGERNLSKQETRGKYGW
jgi:Mitotic checkpoint regulator, MAD2B-interacting